MYQIVMVRLFMDQAMMVELAMDQVVRIGVMWPVEPVITLKL
jgi:hypothetical protein